MNKERLTTLVKILGVAACLYLFLVGIGGVGEAFKIVNSREPTRVKVLMTGDEKTAATVQGMLSKIEDLVDPQEAITDDQVILIYQYEGKKKKYDFQEYLEAIREKMRQPGVLPKDTPFKVVGIENLAGKLMNATSASSIQSDPDAQVPLRLAILGLFIGVLATSIVQSSSTTTSIIVGMVAAEAIGVRGAIFMVMGANIGTTITAKLVSLGHLTRSMEFRRAFAAASVHDTFNLVTTGILFPLEYAFGVMFHTASWLSRMFENMGGIKLGNPLKAATGYSVDAMASMLGQDPMWVLVVSVVVTFAMLWAIVKLLQALVLSRLESFFDTYLFRNAGIALAVGLFLTVAVQSSSITTSLIIPLAGAGVLRLQQIFPFTIGSNIGTTVTALLVALANANPAAVTVALAHTLFNCFGALLFLPVKRIRELPSIFAEKLAEFCLKNRLLPVALILLVFFIIPLIFTWTTLAEIFGNP